MPDREELAAMLDSMAERYSLNLNGSRDAAIDAAVGLSGEEAESCFARSLVSLKRIDPARIAAEKKSVISKAGLLTWLEPLKGGFDAVGGLDVIKSWTLKRKLAYTPAARAYGLTTPRGIFIGGISGCGKSYITGAIATELGNVPLIALDIGALKSKYVGESEANFRKALDTINTIGRCVVRIDEIEKALAGATQGAADGGVSADALGTLLTWMQDRTNEAFIVATANDVTALPPEMLRKGRWDELFWVDLPTPAERVQVLQAALRKAGRTFPASTDWNGLAIATDKFTGAEIAALVPDAMFTAFADGEREVDANDIVRAARDLTPLADTAKDKIQKMRDWAKGKARPATTPEVAQVVPLKAGRALDM
jgi:SpoVK/Ycf46/Vps4 family AAA+-type ATPase